MKGICSYDGEEINYEWKNGETYNGLDEHHNPPEFLFKDKDKAWKGKTYFLCRKHHVELHREIKIILNRMAETIKFVNSEDWLCKKMSLKQIEQVQKEVYNFTEEWIKDGNSRETSAEGNKICPA